jgi:hypothetical protein
VPVIGCMVPLRDMLRVIPTRPNSTDWGVHSCFDRDRNRHRPPVYTDEMIDEQKNRLMMRGTDMSAQRALFGTFFFFSFSEGKKSMC